MFVLRGQKNNEKVKKYCIFSQADLCDEIDTWPRRRKQPSRRVSMTPEPPSSGLFLLCIAV